MSQQLVSKFVLHGRPFLNGASRVDDQPLTSHPHAFPYLFSALTRQVCSRAVTVAVFASGLIVGKNFAWPAWMLTLLVYIVSAMLSRQLPHAHGDNCRPATTLAVAMCTASHISPTAGVISAALIWLSPAWALWWPKDSQEPFQEQEHDVSEQEAIEKVFTEIIAWMESHDNQLPKEHRVLKTDSHREEADLRMRYRKYTTRKQLLISQSKKLTELHAKIVDAADSHDTHLKLLTNIEQWSANNSGKLPQHCRNDPDQCVLARKLQRLLELKEKKPIVAQRLDALLQRSHITPTKPQARGGKKSWRHHRFQTSLQQL